MGVGSYMKDTVAKKIKKKHVVLSLVALGIYIVFCTFNGSISMSIRDYGEHGAVSYFCYYFIGVMGSTLCILMCRTVENTILKKILAPLGKATFYIMAVHVLCLNILQKAFPLWRSGWKYFISFAVVAVMVFIIMMVRMLIQKHIPLKLR